MSKREEAYERVTAWNKERNDLKYDYELEVKMLMEELMEILTAKTKAERLRECADFFFVIMGTAAKIDAAGSHIMDLPQTDALSEWCDANLDWAESVAKEDGTNHLIWDAILIICDANDKKPKDPTTGKVVKGPDYVDPIGLIEELINGNQ